MCILKPTLNEVAEIIGAANRAAPMATNWYKSKKVIDGLSAAKSFIIINASYNKDYVAHVLPIRFWNAVDIDISELEKVEPTLMKHWLNCEHGQSLATLNITSN